jgi:amino acid transporter
MTLVPCSFACATFISTVATLGTSFEPSPKTTIGRNGSFFALYMCCTVLVGIYAAVLFSQGLTNTFGVHLLHYLNNISVWWHAIGTTSLVIAILAKAPNHQSAKFVFRQFIDGTASPPDQGWGDRASHVYVVVIGVRWSY